MQRPKGMIGLNPLLAEYHMGSQLHGVPLLKYLAQRGVKVETHGRYTFVHERETRRHMDAYIALAKRKAGRPGGIAREHVMNGPRKPRTLRRNGEDCGIPSLARIERKLDQLIAMWR